MLETLPKITQSYETLKTEAPHLIDDLIALMVGKVALCASPSDESWAFCSLPLDLTKEAVCGRGPQNIQDLVEKVMTHFERPGLFKSKLKKFDADTLDLFAQAGYPFKDIFTPVEIVQLSLTKGPKFGWPMWKSIYPRKHPISALFEETKFSIPNGLSDQGAKIIADYIRGFSYKNATNAMYKANSSADWRIVLAFHMANLEDFEPSSIIRISSFQSDFYSQFRELFSPPTSAHQAIIQQARRQNGPDIETVLKHGPDRPDLRVLFPESV